jgi:DNA-binding phage protein
MSNKLDMFDSQSMQKQHENEALYLRLKYLKQSAETLVRQKNFLMETIEKSREELKHQMEVLEEAMTSQNKSKSYLISVEKATKQTRNMSELGENALSNIENIIKFLKVEKMYELVFQAEPPVQPSIHSIIEKESNNTLLPKTEHHIEAENSIDATNKVALPGSD